MFPRDDTREDDGPLVAGVNPASGMFSRSGMFSSSAPVGPVRASTVRITACASLVLAVLWVWGFGSLFAVALGLLAVTRSQAGRVFRLIGGAGLVLGIAGLVLAMYLFATYSPPQGP